MAVSFYTTFPNETVYTYELQDVVVNAPVSQLRATYRIYQDTDNTRTMIFQTTYTPNGNYVHLLDFGTFIEQYIIANGGNLQQYAVVVQNTANLSDTAELVLWVLFCRQKRSAPTKRKHPH